MMQQNDKDSLIDKYQNREHQSQCYVGDSNNGFSVKFAFHANVSSGI